MCIYIYIHTLTASNIDNDNTSSKWDMSNGNIWERMYKDIY